ncbi:anti-sigma factor family protein [Alysiella filiformis]|uniref:Zinc-finger n=1 Tax=Alysiella filiformis DSM 16848 TaxID=1120981 RepID=A0A286EGL7_9NEIS|nr:hypothetical protein [Alysiella filiformis]QMT30530.1 zf-HC2 domain-containing protein [Alysiella filiformis]UBQ56490.1 hypothetical protein JF568_01540 [Alysiella filiformis DSM 16848]SOD69954.1 hypothetical protein SAMN02746062_01906 [Alysiella filiformis DSM 16848]
MMNCFKITQWISQSQDVALSSTQKMSLYLHIKMCRKCRNYHQNIHFLRELMKKM